jgi:hypothetical protein
MQRLRLIALGACVLAVGGQSLIAGRAQQPAASSSPSATGQTPLDALHFRSIGPASMSGRISDLAVYEPNPSLYYVATAHGGVWKTTNNGTTFEAQLQNHGHMSIGDVTVSQSNPDLVWVGTGESNNRQSTSWGDGVYKSLDGGKTYTNMGLRTSKHINRIVIDPRDNDVVLVAATGSLWGAGGERGVFKTSDGGSTWRHVLKVDDDTGANELVMDPANSRIVYASTYQRRRTACCMNGGGPGSGIWKSVDGGETWTRSKGGVLDQPLRGSGAGGPRRPRRGGGGTRVRSGPGRAAGPARRRRSTGGARGRTAGRTRPAGDQPRTHGPLPIG